MIRHTLYFAKLALVSSLNDAKHIAIHIDTLAPILIADIKFQPLHCIISRYHLNIFGVMFISKHIDHRGLIIFFTKIVLKKCLDVSFECRCLAHMVSKQNITIPPRRKNAFINECLPIKQCILNLIVFDGLGEAFFILVCLYTNHIGAEKAIDIF